MPLHTESDSCSWDRSGVGLFSRKKSLEKLCVFVFRCEGKILLTLFGDHIFPSGDWNKKNSFTSWRLPKKVNFRPWDRGPLSLNPIVPRFLMPSRISHKLHVFGWSFDWFTWQSVPFCDPPQWFLWFCFYHTPSKTGLVQPPHWQWKILSIIVCTPSKMGHLHNFVGLITCNQLLFWWVGEGRKMPPFFLLPPPVEKNTYLRLWTLKQG